MKKNLGDYRKSYEKRELLENSVSDNPMQLFQTWFYEVEQMEVVDEVNAMSVATIGLDGFPKTRIVLLKEYTHEGFIFYTNYESEKGRAIAENPNICISFFWPSAERQIIIKGKAEKIAPNKSDGYFESRPEGSRLGAIVSNQSQVIPSRAYLEDKLKALAAEHESKPIERPDYWGGYLVRPVEMEFWQGRANRLHDRLRYTLDADLNWIMARLAP